tara:strand:+ start:528 stop:1676 length:1149 start_codon:yes stop_codon:yes gene_type:complete
MSFNIRNILCLFLIIIIYQSFYSQHSEENIDYIKQKEIELTNDSSYWDNHSILYFGFNRVGLYNWAAGGMNFMEIHGLANMRFDYRHNKFHWNNFINLQLGVIKSGYGNQGIWLKNDDLIELRSKFSRRTKHLWDYSFLIDVRSQFTYGYYTEYDRLNNFYMDNFLSPIYPIFAFGFDYHASNNLTIDVSPFTAKSTIVLDDSLSRIGVFGLEPNEKYRYEAGLYMNLLYSHDSLFGIKNLHFMTDVTVFGNYLDSPGNIDLTCEVLASYHLNDFLSLTFQGYLIYDDDIKIPRYEADGMTPIYLTRRDNQLDPITGDNHYFIDYNDYQNNPSNYNYNLDYVSNGIEDGFIDPGDYEGYKIIKTGAALQFMEYWMLGLSFSF